MKSDTVPSWYWWAPTVLLILASISTSISAQEIPEPLKPWKNWVLYEHPEIVCAHLGGTRQCDWPGTLSVAAQDKGATFEMTVWLDRNTRVQLPGSRETWPQNVVNAAGTPLVLQVDSNAFPQVELSAGAHTIRGQFEWPQPPEVVQVPPQVGMVKLALRDRPIEHPRLDGEGRLWLDIAGGDQALDQTDSLRVSLYRQIHDGVPMRIVTRIQLNVSGRAREVELGKILIDNARPYAIKSNLPVQINTDGNVKVYIKPGTHQVEIEALLTNNILQLKAPKLGGEEFDPQEVWVWKPNETLRSVEISGLAAVDPERTSLPEDWRGGTTFLAEPGQTLTLKQTRRGEAELAPNIVQLHRTLWLDLDGKGYTVRDTLNGTLNQDWRLNHAPGADLGRVTLSNGSGDLLITSDEAAGMSGVELRQSQLQLQAELRMEDARSTIKAVGWDHDVQRLSAEINLPPGWTLLGGSGVDQMHGTWVDSWTLFDFFFVLMVALTLGKLCGWRWALLAGLALCLSHGHDDAPRWIWFHLLASLALLRVLPEGWWRRGILLYRGAALITLGLILAPFAQEQVRFALHPQVATNTFTLSPSDYGGFQMNEKAQDISIMEAEEAADIPASAMPDQKRVSAKKMDKSKDMRSWGGKGNAQKAYNQATIQLQQVDPNAVVQTGPGLPTWNWNKWQLAWTGPVRKDHTISLWLLSPNYNRALTFLRVAADSYGTHIGLAARYDLDSSKQRRR